MKLYHGGVRGLLKGSMLLPPNEHDGYSLRDYGRETTRGKAEALEVLMRGDRVFLTTDRRAALAFAHVYPGGGALYVAEPIGPTEPDPDNPRISVTCARAIVRTVYDPVVPFDPDAWALLLRDYLPRRRTISIPKVIR